MKRILVVDDDPLLRRLILNILKEEGREVITACNGQEGFDLFQLQKIDLVITDLEMPFMNGLELIGKIRETSQQEIILLSGNTEFDDIKVPDGVIKIKKPFSPEVLSSVVQKMLAD